MGKWWRSNIIKGIVLAITIACASLAGYEAANMITYAEKVSEENKAMMEEGGMSSCTSAFGINFDCTYTDAVAKDPHYQLYSTYEILLDYHLRYVSEEHITSGNLISEETADDVKSKFISEHYAELLDIENTYEQKLDDLYNIYYEDLDSKEYKAKVSEVTREQIGQWNYIKSEYEKALNNYKYIIYMVDGTIYTNIESENTSNANIFDYFKQFPLHDTYTIGYYSPVIGGYGVNDTPSNVSEIQIAMTEEYYDFITSGYQEPVNNNLSEHGEFKNMIYNLFIAIIGYIIGAIYLMIVAGKNNKDDELHLITIDYIYLDVYTIGLCVIWPLAILLACFVAALHIDAGYYSITFNANEVFMLYIIIGGILGIITVSYLTTLSKHIKKHDVIRYTLVMSCIFGIMNLISRMLGKCINIDINIRKQIDRMVLLYAVLQIVVLTGLFMIVVDSYLFFACFVISVVFGVINFFLLRTVLFQYVSELDIIKRGVTIIANGNLDYQIPRLTNKSLNDLAMSVNSVTEGLKFNVEERVSSEKTKMELITNVSHDLKTPLTSIISYIDLLSKSTDAEESKHYLEVLELKSNQLKKLVEDLFEITKVQNGQIEADLERICIDDLMSQILAEYDESFVTKGLTIRYTPLETKTMVYADGNKMYRVIGNIIGNAIKYSMDNTRVYIDFEKDDTNLDIIFKNISNYEMNFDVSEMNQRFKRGDESRTSEGNGLGLAIADSFMNIQNGSLDISKDGDLFKVKVTIPMIIEEETTEE